MDEITAHARECHEPCETGAPFRFASGSGGASTCMCSLRGAHRQSLKAAGIEVERTGGGESPAPGARLAPTSTSRCRDFANGSVDELGRAESARAYCADQPRGAQARFTSGTGWSITANPLHPRMHQEVNAVYSGIIILKMSESAGPKSVRKLRDEEPIVRAERRRRRIANDLALPVSETGPSAWIRRRAPNEMA